jgi:hypothetical protein
MDFSPYKVNFTWVKKLQPGWNPEYKNISYNVKKKLFVFLFLDDSAIFR